MKVKLIGIDLAKSVFHVCALNRAGRVLFNRRLRRAQLVKQLQDLVPTALPPSHVATPRQMDRP